MNSAKTCTVITADSEETQELGRQIGQNLKGGGVIELVGDLGSGKTTLVQGVLRGLGYQGDVPSPTFTLSRSYDLGRGLSFHHFDCYRLNGPDLVTDELAEVAGAPGAIVAVEWAGHGEATLPRDRLTISIEPTEQTSGRSVYLQSRGPQSDAIIEKIAL